MSTLLPVFLLASLPALGGEAPCVGAGDTAEVCMNAPTHSIRHPAEFEPVASLWTTYPGWSDYDSFFLDLVAASLPHAEVHVLADRRDGRRLRGLLRAAGLLDVRIHTGLPFETIWLRDYGPEPILVDGALVLLDPIYCDDCPLDDDLATRLAGSLDLSAWRPPLLMDGGHVQSNGAGTCFTTTALVHLNQDEPLEELLRRWLGCAQVVALEPLVGQVVDHVDMFLYVAAEDLVLLGEYTQDQDPDNRAILEANAAKLASTRLPDGRPLRLVRLPMPDHAFGGDGPLPRSHLNMVAVNGAVLVPVYADTPSEVRVVLHERVEAAFPGRAVVLVEADIVARDQGAIHCVVRTLPMVAN